MLKFFSISATLAATKISIQNPNNLSLSSFKSSIPSSIVFNRSRNLSQKAKAQYFAPQEQQENHKQRFSSSDPSFPSQSDKAILNSTIKGFALSQSKQEPKEIRSHTRQQPRVYVGYSVYKGKAALAVQPCPPQFSPLDSGSFKLSKEGFVLLQFAPASGVRQYDWGRKQVFSLSVTEIGHMISLGARDSCEFFHDPNKGRSDEGKVRKVLKVEPLPDGSGHFFNLSVQNKLLNLDESIYIPITKAEFAVLTSSFNFILPYLLGWHTFATGIKAEDTSRVNNVNPRSGADLEWNR